MSIDAYPPLSVSTDATLDALAGLSTSANTMPFFTGVDTAALTALTPFMRTLLDDPDLATAQATLGITGGGGGGAPTDAEYIVGSAHGTLTQERVLTTTPTVAWDLTTAGQAKATVPDASITEVKLGLSDVTTQNVSTTAHGLTPKLSGVATQYLDGTGLWSVPPAGTTYTDEQAQDAVGAMLVDTATIDLTYGDGGPTLQADVKDLSITEAKLTFVDITTRDASTTAHGLLRKLSGTATQYLDGSGAWTTPAGGTNYWTRSQEPNTLATAFTAWWKLDEASGSRVDSVAALALTPVGGANLTQVAGKIGNAVGMNGTMGTYLTMANTAAVQMSTTTSFTVLCWVYLTTVAGGIYVSKGNAGANATYEYLLYVNPSNKFRFAIANGTTFQNLDDTGPVPSLNTWYLLIGWYDAGAGTLNLQVNNGTVLSAAATMTSYASTHAMDIGRYAGYGPSSSLNGRIDLVGIGKRVLTTTERSALWNSGAGLDYPFGTGAGFYIAPLTATDSLLLGATRTTPERLEVDGAIKVGTAVGTTDGTLRWSGTDMEARKGGAWVSMTAGGGGQPLDATLTALAGLTTAADRVPYFTGVDTAALATFTAAGRTLAGAADAAAQRGALALGTMAQQDANAVAITGGSAQLTGTLGATGQTTLTGTVGVQGAPSAFTAMNLFYLKTSQHGITIKPIDSDGGSGGPVVFHNTSAVAVGSIGTNATATSFNTSSDVRLKHAITPLTGALDVVRRLRPGGWLWNADGSPGEGFLAHELMREVPLAVTGEPDAVNEDGSVKPQQVDHSRLVPWLTAALQETLAQVQALTARVAALEGATP